MTSVRHQRPTSAVHLAGSFILADAPRALYGTMRQHYDNVLTLVSITPDVVLLSGFIFKGGMEAAGYTSET